MSLSPYPSPQGGSALPLTFHFHRSSSASPVLVVGANRLAASRCYTLLDADAKVVLYPGRGRRTEEWDEEVRWRVEKGQVELIDTQNDGDITEEDDDANDDDQQAQSRWTRFLQSIQPPIGLVTVTDTVLLSSTTTTTSRSKRSYQSALSISSACRGLHIPINVADHAELSTFSFPAVHRFPSSTFTNGASPRLSNLQIAISTNNQGCRLAGRIKRDIVAGKGLAKGWGAAVDNVGELRRRVRTAGSGEIEASRIGRLQVEREGESVVRDAQEDVAKQEQDGAVTPTLRELEEDDQAVFLEALNSPVPQLSSTGTTASIAKTAVHSGHGRNASDYFTAAEAPASTAADQERLRRMRWISQISEYWSVDYLARMGKDEMGRVLSMWEGGEGEAKDAGGGAVGGGPGGPRGSTPSVFNRSNAYGGSAPTPGPPITPRHGLALSVPPAPPAPQRRGRILLLGSGPGHPSLLTVAAHTALRTSTLILSDKLVPSEILALVPANTTLHIAKKFPGNAEGAQNEMMELALEGALRGEVVVRLKQGDPFVYGRGGEEVLFFRKHGFEPVVVPGVSSALAGPLMMGIPVTQRGVAESMVLCTGVGRKGKAVQLPGYVRGRTLVVLMGVARIRQVIDVLTRQDSAGRDGAAYPSNLPIAIIERASSHDQRMVASTLAGIEDALVAAGDQRPPGMMIIGWAVLALEGEGEVTVLDDEEDLEQQEQQQRDQDRVDRWLAGKKYLLKDGLGDEWARFITPEIQAQVEQAETIDTYQEYNRG